MRRAPHSETASGVIVGVAWRRLLGVWIVKTADLWPRPIAVSLDGIG